jgi:predicted outer membrane repeat protein
MLLLLQCRFDSNQAYRGSAVAVEPTSQFGKQPGMLAVTNSTFTNNLAGAKGAIYSLYSTNITVVSSAFTENISEREGAAIHTGSSNVTLRDCTFTQNAAAGNGGAVYISALNVSEAASASISQVRVLCSCVYADSTAWYEQEVMLLHVNDILQK